MCARLVVVMHAYNVRPQLVDAATPEQAGAVLAAYRDTLSELNVALTAHATVSDAQVRGCAVA